MIWKKKLKETSEVRELDTKHPWYPQRKSAYDALNEMTTRVKENRMWIKNELYFSINIIAALTIAYFTNIISHTIYSLLVASICIFFVHNLKTYESIRWQKIGEKKKLKIKFDELGLTFP